MDLERKRHIIEVSFGFDKITISEVIDLCLNIDSEDTNNILDDLESKLIEEYPNEL